MWTVDHKGTLPSGIRSSDSVPRPSRFRSIPGGTRRQAAQTLRAPRSPGSRSLASSSAARAGRAPRSSRRPAAATRGVSLDDLVGAREDRPNAHIATSANLGERTSLLLVRGAANRISRVVEEPENIVLRALDRIREQNDTILRKLDEVITRLSAVERDIAGIKVDYAATQLRLDNMDRRIERIERRLELAEA